MCYSERLKTIFFGSILFFLGGCKNRSVESIETATLPCVMMQATTWFLPSGKKDWWHVRAATTLLAERDSALEFRQIKARYVKNGAPDQLLVIADSGSYERATSTVYFEGNVSTKITFSPF